MQIINRHNYESWLMLYLDNELTAEERSAVEAFAAAHPDVQEELNGLKGVLLQPELPAAMPGKERLLMPEVWNEEALTRQQEQLLMLADNELPAYDRAMFETEIDQDHLLQKEWQLLRAATLQAEQPAEMPFKEKLFRKEPARVIPIGRILRFAAAAAILAFGWFFVDRISGPSQNDADIPKVVKVDTDEKNAAGSTTVDQPISQDSSNEEAEEVQVNDNLMAKKVENNLTKPEHNKAVKSRANEDVVPMLAANNQPADAVVERDAKRDLTNKIASVTYIDVEGVDATDAPIVSNAGNPAIAAVLQEQKPMAAYEVVNADELMEDESISIAGARIPKQKIRSLYRNITRPLARSFEKNQAPRTEVK